MSHWPSIPTYIILQPKYDKPQKIQHNGKISSHTTISTIGMTQIDPYSCKAHHMDLKNDHTQKDWIKLPPQTQDLGVEYSPFIMEMVETSLEKMETYPAALHRSFPLQSAAPDLRFGVSCFGGALVRESPGDPLYSHFQVKKKLQEEGSTATESRGPSWWVPRGQVQWLCGPPLFWPSGLHFLASFDSKSSSFQNNDPRKRGGDLYIVWVSET